MIKDKAKLKTFNLTITRVIYLPLSIVVAIFFMIINLLLLPLAFLKTLLHKMILLYRLPSKKRCLSLSLYFLLGIPMLLISQITDVIHFFVHSNKYDQ